MKWAWAAFWAIVLLSVLAALPGCATLNGLGRVEVPVAVACTPPAIPAPSLPIDAVSPNANEFEFARALWATIETLEGYTQHLEAVVDVCRGR